MNLTERLKKMGVDVATEVHEGDTVRTTRTEYWHEKVFGPFAVEPSEELRSREVTELGEVVLVPMVRTTAAIAGGVIIPGASPGLHHISEYKQLTVIERAKDT